MVVICPCGKKVIVISPSRVGRTKYCDKSCFYKYRKRSSGLKYKIIKKNSTWFKKGHVSWTKGLIEELQPNWKGNKVGYWGVHNWIEKHFGKPKKCEICRSINSKKYDWANKNHLYHRNRKDWMRVCVKCHQKYDFKKFGLRKGFFNESKLNRA